MTTLTTDSLKQAHKLLAEFEYELRPVERGYANRTLHVNLSDNTITSEPVTQQMKDTFTGGRGFCLWLLWNAVQDNTKWDDPKTPSLSRAAPSAASRPIPVPANRPS